MLKICMYATVAGEELRFAPPGPKRHSYQGYGEWLGWALAGAFMLVALSFWIGSHGATPGNAPNAVATVTRLPPEPGPPQPKGSHAAMQFQSLETSGDQSGRARIAVVEQREQLSMPALKPQIGPMDQAGSENAEEAQIAKSSN